MVACVEVGVGVEVRGATAVEKVVEKEAVEMAKAAGEMEAGMEVAALVVEVMVRAVSVVVTAQG